MCSSSDELLEPIKSRRTGNGFRFLMMSLWSSAIPHGLINHSSVSVHECVHVQKGGMLLCACLYRWLSLCLKKLKTVCVMNVLGGQRPLIWCGSSFCGSSSQLLFKSFFTATEMLVGRRRGGGVCRRMKDGHEEKWQWKGPDKESWLYPKPFVLLIS